MSAIEAIVLVAGGLVAGVVNSMAGGGSLITVSLLIWVGLPGDVANGSNRVGVLLSMLTAARGFSSEGASGVKNSLRVLVPCVLGAIIGAYLIAQLDADVFQRVFAFLMIPLLLLGLRPPKVDPATAGLHNWPPAVTAIVFFAIGIYGGAFQAGVGLVLIVALSYAGFDLVMANSVKVILVLGMTTVALPIFILAGQVDWAPALVLGLGLAIGGRLGAGIAVRGGEKIIRPVLVVSVLIGAAKLLGLFG
jgi:uncharacterized protein